MNSYTKVKQRCMFQYKQHTHKTNNIHTYVYVVHCVPVYIKLTPITCVCVCVCVYAGQISVLQKLSFRRKSKQQSENPLHYPKNSEVCMHTYDIEVHH